MNKPIPEGLCALDLRRKQYSGEQSQTRCPEGVKHQSDAHDSATSIVNTLTKTNSNLRVEKCLIH